MTHREKQTVARLLMSLAQQDKANTEQEKSDALEEARAAVRECSHLVIGYNTTWERK